MDISRRIPVLMLALGSVLVVQLGMRVSRLEERASVLQERAYHLYPGLDVPSFVTTTMDGDTVTVGDTDGAPQVLFVFATECPYSRESLPAWISLQSEFMASGPGSTAIAVSVDSPDATLDYVLEHGLQGVVSFPTRKIQSLYRIRQVPQLIVLNSDGVVTYTRTGELTDPLAVDSIRSAFGSRQ